MVKGLRSNLNPKETFGLGKFFSGFRVVCSQTMTGTPEATTWKVLLEVCLNDMTVLRAEIYTVHD